MTYDGAAYLERLYASLMALRYPHARWHFAEYVRLDPRGYWSRRAREALDRLSGG